MDALIEMHKVVVRRAWMPILLLALWSQSLPVRAQKPALPKLHALLVIDTDSNLGEFVRKDQEAVERVLKEGFETRPHRLDLTVFAGQSAAPSAIERYYLSLQRAVKPNDTVLFYYTGHGAADNEGHFLQMANGALHRDKLRGWIKSTNPRLAVILTDSCSKKLGPRVPELKAPPKASWPAMDSLFFQHAGVADVNGCQKDAFSWVFSDDAGRPQGSTFTMALVPALCKKPHEFRNGDDERFVSWEQFNEALQIDTDALFQTIRKRPGAEPALLRQDKQEPEIFSNGQVSHQNISENVWLFGAETASALKGNSKITVITKVYPGTPAAEAQFEINDIILSVDGVKVTTPNDFTQSVQFSSGEIRIAFERGSRRLSEQVKLKPVKPVEPN